jgi:branched-subunit amino acid ABC-type transport system permease component
VAALDVLVACALYRVFKPVSAGLSRLASGLRIAYAAVFTVAISQLAEALRQHTQALRHINTFTNIWDAGLVLFGLNLFVLAYMAYRSVYVPKLLAVLLATAGFGYIFDSVARALLRGSSSDVSAITGMGEFVFALWLVVRGRRIALDDSGSHADSTGAAR